MIPLVSGECREFAPVRATPTILYHNRLERHWHRIPPLGSRDCEDGKGRHRELRSHGWEGEIQPLGGPDMGTPPCGIRGLVRWKETGK